jgi:hypothetical protein
MLHVVSPLLLVPDASPGSRPGMRAINAGRCRAWYATLRTVRAASEVLADIKAGQLHSPRQAFSQDPAPHQPRAAPGQARGPALTRTSTR